jgi:hypothetical protein
MRRLFILLSVAGLLATIASSAAMGAARERSDSASGLGVRGGNLDWNVLFSFDARSGPSGESPTGTFMAAALGLVSFEGEVGCLRVSGHTAVIAGTITKGQQWGDDLAGSLFLTVIEDRGQPRNGISPDLMSGVEWGDNLAGFTLQELCDDPGSIPDMTPNKSLLKGDVTVKDSR